MIAVIAALPREIAALVGSMKPDRVERGVFRYRMGSAVVVAAGMGAARATLAVEAAMAVGAVELLVSTGLAGGCRADVLPGEVIEARQVVDIATGERWSCQASGGEVLATGPSIADVREKARLAAAYGAAMVDMEAATVARLAAVHGVPFRAIKAISDGHEFELPALAKFAGPRGEFRTAAFALHTAMRPSSWPQAVALGKNSGRALAGLTEALRRLTGV